MKLHKVQTTLQTQHTKILERIRDETPTNKWKLKLYDLAPNFLGLFSLLASTTLLAWFINNLIQNSILLRPSLEDISGVEWVWLPEILGLSILFYFVGISMYKSLNYTSFKYVGIGIVFLFAILLNLGLSTPATFAFQSNIQPTYNSLGYRVFFRDNHVNALMNHNTFYGVVVGQTSDTVEVNHGGVIKSFTLKFSISNLINKPVEIHFEKANNEHIVNSINILT